MSDKLASLISQYTNISNGFDEPKTIESRILQQLIQSEICLSINNICFELSSPNSFLEISCMLEIWADRLREYAGASQRDCKHHKTTCTDG